MKPDRNDVIEQMLRERREELATMADPTTGPLAARWESLMTEIKTLNEVKRREAGGGRTVLSDAPLETAQSKPFSFLRKKS